MALTLMRRGLSRAWHTAVNDVALVMGARAIITSALRSTLRSTARHVAGPATRATGPRSMMHEANTASRTSVYGMALESSALTTASTTTPARSAVLSHQHTLMG